MATCYASHTKFLTGSKTLHLIADNYATHKHPTVQEWLVKHPRFVMHFTPTSASWLNMVERFFRGFGVFALLHAAVGQLFVLPGAVGDFLAEGIAFAEFLAHGVDDVVGVAVGLGEDQGLGDFLTAGEDGRQVVAEGADDGADLVRVDDVAVKLGGGVGGVFVLLLPTFFRVRRSRFSTCCSAAMTAPCWVIRVSIR